MKRCRNACVFSVLLVASTSFAQTGEPYGAPADTVNDLRRQLRQTQEQLSRSEGEIRELRANLDRMQQQLDQLAAPGRGQSVEPSSSAGATETQNQSPSVSSDEWQMLNAKVEEHQQVKVESASKFRLKLSGMVLFNAFSTAGSVDNIDVPEFAVPRPVGAPHGSSGASLRQSIIGLTGIGPQIAGAHTSADLQMDFYGGMPSGYSQSSSGLARLRIARMRMDWEKTSIIAGLDAPFFSPNSPTSYMTVGEPAFSGAGNLWSWLPTLRIEQRQKIGTSQLKLEAGLIDYAAYEGYRTTSGRYPTPGESTRQPAYSTRISFNRPNEDHPFSIGVGGIYIPQSFPWGKDVSGWGGTSDIRIPITTHAEITGEFFTGNGIEGFGGTTLGFVPTQDFHYTYVTGPKVATLLTIGGWSQVKYRLNSRNEFNAAAGYGGFSSSRLRFASIKDTYLTSIPARNQSMLANYIFRPRSDLLFSLEYRHLRTFSVNGAPATADQVGVAAGFLF